MHQRVIPSGIVQAESLRRAKLSHMASRPERRRRVRLGGNGEAAIEHATDRLDRIEAAVKEIRQTLDAALPEIQHTLDVQFKRIAAIQAELDLLKGGK